MEQTPNQQPKKATSTFKKSYNTAFASLSNIPFYPVSYAKLLIQIGHEPLPPFKSTSIFGKEQFYNPNIFSYVRYIGTAEGLVGLYRGLGMKILSNVSGNYAHSFISRYFEAKDEENKEAEPEEGIARFIKETRREITKKTCAIVFSHPFHVMAVRCMAQFVGGETEYSSWNFFQNTITIYRNEGLGGFFSGLVPRLIFETSTIALTNLIAYLIKTYLFDDKEVEIFVDLFASMCSSTITYPISVVSSVSIVAGSGLVAGQPPKMPLYKSWIEIFKDLNTTNQLKRGSSSFFRVYYPLPIVKFTGLNNA